jgi:hypothetical protein
VLTLQALQEANRALGAVLGELQHIGWLARKSATTEVSAPSVNDINCFQDDQRLNFEPNTGLIIFKHLILINTRYENILMSRDC